MKMQYEHDGSLVQRAVSGDGEALCILIAEYQPFIRSIAFRLSASASMQDELFQVGNIGLYQAIMRYNPECGAKLLTYAWPWILGEMRKALRVGCGQFATVSLQSGIDPEGRPLEEVLAGVLEIDITGIDLRNAISRLPEEEQILICLRYYRDKSQTETALLLKKSQAQVSKMERRVLDKLCTMLS